MKQLLKTNVLPLGAAILGIIGCALRWLLYAVATDQKNLIPLGHPLEIGLWLVTAAAALLILFSVWKLRNAHRGDDRFQKNIPAAAGSGFMALCILIAVLGDGLNLSGLALVRDLLGVLSAVALAVIAMNRCQGRRPFFLLHGLVCVFFAVHGVSCYRGWSCNPQMMDYVFTLFANTGLMLFAFYHGCLEVDMGKLRMLPGVGLLTAYCCAVALSGGEYALIYLGGALWTLTNLLGLHTGE